MYIQALGACMHGCRMAMHHVNGEPFWDYILYCLFKFCLGMPMLATLNKYLIYIYICMLINCYMYIQFDS